MEATLNSERIEQLIEQPDLYEIYQELDGTIGGITLPLKDLAKMCPIDLNDPRISLEDKNKFVVTGLNNAHAEISPKHVTIFENTLEAQGRQRNFIISKVDNSEHISITKHHDPEVQLDQLSWSQVKFNSKEDKLPPATILQEIISSNNDSLRSNDFNRLKEREQSEENQIPDSNSTPDKLINKNPNVSNKDETFIEISKIPILDSEPFRALQDSKVVSIPELRPYNPEVVDKIEIINEATEDQQIKKDLTILSRHPLSEEDFVINEEIDSSNDLNQLNIASASEYQQIWENLTILSELPDPQEDLGINEGMDLEYENLNFVSKFQIRLLNSVNMLSTQEQNDQNNIMPIQDAIAIEIIEGIDNLNPELLPSLKTILDEIDKSLNAIITKDHREEDKLINDIQLLKIQELTSQLFELCQINCSDAEKNDFIALLLNPEFNIASIDLVAVDPENMGTREIKRRQKIVTSNRGTIRNKIQKVIGDFVLSFELIIDSGLKYPI